jgi:hypothetical protein
MYQEIGGEKKKDESKIILQSNFRPNNPTLGAGQHINRSTGQNVTKIEYRPKRA